MHLSSLSWLPALWHAPSTGARIKTTKAGSSCRVPVIRQQAPLSCLTPLLPLGLLVVVLALFGLGPSPRRP